MATENRSPITPDAALEACAEPEGDMPLEAALMHLSGAVQAHLVETAAAFGFTPQQAYALRQLEQPTPMGDLATRMHCDASNVTGIVDRLERRGLVRREADTADRRVKRLVVTDEGRALREQLEARMFGEFPFAATLAGPDRERVAEAIRLLLGETRAAQAQTGERRRPEGVDTR